MTRPDACSVLWALLFDDESIGAAGFYLFGSPFADHSTIAETIVRNSFNFFAPRLNNCSYCAPGVGGKCYMAVRSQSACAPFDDGACSFINM